GVDGLGEGRHRLGVRDVAGDRRAGDLLGQGRDAFAAPGRAHDVEPGRGEGAGGGGPDAAGGSGDNGCTCLLLVAHAPHSGRISPVTIIAAADGSALGNPGPAGWGW